LGWELKQCVKIREIDERKRKERKNLGESESETNIAATQSKR